LEVSNEAVFWEQSNKIFARVNLGGRPGSNGPVAVSDTVRVYKDGEQV
jgi:hypothetical protein